MLSDPTPDDLGFFGAGILDRLRVVGVVGLPQVEMMRRLLDVDDVDEAVAADLLSQAAGCPGIQLAIREDDVRDGQEVALNILTTEVVPHPVVPGSHLVFLLAVLSEGVVVEGLCDKHRVGTV